MSDPKLISPLLDGFTMGNPMSSHDGVRCSPALKENSENKYIVKTIAVPASQVQLDALLLTGACKDPADAMDYFKALADELVQEAELLSRLSRLEGFLPYDSWQVVPMEDGRLGYEVYLVSSYKRSLEKFIRRNTVTHLDAVNMGLDLCQALSICRRAGYLYADLKPGNVFISRDREYRIGDLGFVALDSLDYTSLPSKYISPYSPPEVTDPMKTLNLTVDTYAVGMILYQVYNGGTLPKAPQEPSESFPTPANADYEISEIILKAISPDPGKRWKDPISMGQALVAYMQRNAVNKTPIVPQGALNTEGVSLAQTEPDPPTPPVEEAPSPEPSAEETPETVEPASAQAAPSPEAPDSPPEETADTNAEQTAPALSQEPSSPETAEIPEPAVQEPVPESAEQESAPEKSEEPGIATEEEPMDDESAAFLEEFGSPFEEAAPQQLHMPELDLRMDEAVLPLLTEPDDDVLTLSLPAVGPKPLEEEPLTLSFPDMLEPDQEDVELFDLNRTPVISIPQPTPAPVISMASPERKQRPKNMGWIRPVILLLVLALLGGAGFWFYQNYYLQPIDALTVDGSMTTLTVTVDTTADQSSLSVVCSDSYGNAYTKPLENGKAVFGDLLPNTQYKIQLQIDGFHKLTGKTTEIFNTQALTNVVSFTAGIGPEDGSVVLTMTVEGGEPDQWLLSYTAQDEEPQTMTFSGTSVTVKGLTVGKTYTFQLGSEGGIPINGITQLEYQATRIIIAENLHVTSINDGNMTVRWNYAEDVIVDSWFVRCYDGQGNEQTQEVTGNAATFPNIDSANSYTIEVTASGMTQPSRVTITANPITITGFQVNDEAADSFTVSWEFEGQAPEGGWLLMYGFNGSTQRSVLKCQEPTAVITPKVPSAGYVFTIQAADSTTVFGGQQSYSTANPGIFSAQGLSADSIMGHLLKTPEGDWSFESVGTNSYSDTFRVGDKLSLVLHAKIGFYLKDQDISVLYVFRDENDAVLQDLVAYDTINWKELWFAGDYHYGELDIPTAPDQPGKYSLSLYFNNSAVIYISFTVT